MLRGVLSSDECDAELERMWRYVSALPYISPISPLYLPYISPISPLHLPYISPISPLYLAYISPTSRLYLAYIGLAQVSALSPGLVRDEPDSWYPSEAGGADPWPHSGWKSFSDMFQVRPTRYRGDMGEIYGRYMGDIGEICSM